MHAQSNYTYTKLKAWYRRLLCHPARKRSEPILNPTDPHGGGMRVKSTSGNAANNVTVNFIYLFIQLINQQWYRSTSNGIEVQTKNILAERPTQG